ncbi:MAG: lytic transglycosylase domain-containing protein [Lentisphaeria bacterium]|nr:lytic transglycosylase domain-containing protein [Lentisphaeria bacterium]
MKKKRKFRPVYLLIPALLAAFALSAVWYWQNRLAENDVIGELFYDDTLYADEIREAAGKYDLPPELIRALIKKESRFNARATGKAGEVGLMQILPRGAVADWARINKCRPPSREELFNVRTNLDIGCWYLARAMRKWEKYRYRMHLALAEYNAGAANTARWKPADPKGEVLSRIDFPGTREYVRDIMESYYGYVTAKP